MEELLQFVSESLDKHGIEYMLSGSVALNAYSIPRYTRDIDIVIELRSENFPVFADIFLERECYFHRESAEEEVRRRGMFNIIDWKSGMKIDFIIRKNDDFQQTEFERRQRKTVLANVDCWIISPEDLIIAKLMWIQELQSQQQLDDIKNLLYDYPLLDKSYVTGWVKKMQLNDFGLFDQ
ncbi:nucleotidyl transferase AbiEii/AbiGii toxin family protein [Spirosoma koreense]